MRGNDTEHSREVNKRAVHIEKKKRKAKKRCETSTLNSQHYEHTLI